MTPRMLTAPPWSEPLVNAAPRQGGAPTFAANDGAQDLASAALRRTAPTLFTYAAEPGSRSQEALNLLGSWAATIKNAEPERSTDQS